MQCTNADSVPSSLIIPGRGRFLKRFGVYLTFAALLFWLGSTAYITGQFEIRETELILNPEGCRHLVLVGLTPQPHPESSTCRVHIPFRPGVMHTGGRVQLADRMEHIPAHQIVAYLPLADHPWTRRHWLLISWEVLSVLLVLVLAGLTHHATTKENQ